MPFLGGPPMPPGSDPYFRMHLANMQKSNWEMQQYRTRDGGAFWPGPVLWPMLPVPWRDRATAAPSPVPFPTTRASSVAVAGIWDCSTSKGLKEKMAMRKLSRAAHIVQEAPPDPIGKPARKNIPLQWREDDSSDEYDSSGDEDTPEYRPANRRRRKARSDFTPQELAAKVRRWFGPPPTVNNDNGPLVVGEASDGEKDFIVLEYLENGDLRNLVAKVRNMGAEFPNRVLWSFWLCLVKQCIAMTYYPRKFHPDRHRVPDSGSLDEFIPPAGQK
ncbi:hypothetical protein DL765_004533 [Monosporascus sp. GIB2]|nr:hypothetical protein DL765_004533 [Monosporascus sp. GIB2]